MKLTQMDMGKTLIICEKPSAAAKIAFALAERQPEKREINGVPYYEFEREGRKIVIVPTSGHLFTLKNLRPMRDYPVFDIDWVPIHEADRKAKGAKFFIEAIRELAKDASELINACDYDVEGEVIAYNVLRYLCGADAVNRAKRMKFSTLAPQDLRQAYENLMPSLNFKLASAGIARHMLDWYWGQNTSKALSSSVKAAHGRFAKLSAGRVQSPLLKILFEREREIKSFKPKPFWVLGLVLELEGRETIAEHKTPRFFDKAEAERALMACKDELAQVKAIQAKVYQRQPPFPFDLGSLQSEAYRCFGYTPMQTQRIAQALYLAGLISYPRTGSQKLPRAIGYEQIIRRLGEIPQYARLAQNLLKLPELKPNEGPKEDPAHPAIFCTGEKPEGLKGPQRKLCDLITRRFLSTFAPPARVEGIRVELDAGGQIFLLRGRRVLERGWMEYYPYAETDEVTLPKLSEGQTLEVKRVLFEERKTQPPTRYNPASIVREMERVGIGTKATRGPILQNVYERGYIFGDHIEVSELGVKVIETLSEYCPDILSERLTAHFEREMEAILEGKQDGEEVIERAKGKLSEILGKFKEHELEIGRRLGEAYMRAKKLQRVIGRCSECGGELKIVVSRRTHKRFVGCSNYPERCTNAYPLPLDGAIVSLEKTCEQCGTPVIQVNRIGMRPYRMCLDPECPSKAKWGRRKMEKIQRKRQEG